MVNSNTVICLASKAKNTNTPFALDKVSPHAALQRNNSHEAVLSELWQLIQSS